MALDSMTFTLVRFPAVGGCNRDLRGVMHINECGVNVTPQHISLSVIVIIMLHSIYVDILQNTFDVIKSRSRSRTM